MYNGMAVLVGYIYELHGVMSISISRVHYGGSVSVYEGERKGVGKSRCY